MGFILAFAPFIAFALVDRMLGATPGLIAGAVVSTALLLRDWAGGRTPKVLEAGSVVLFAGLALYAVLGAPGWSIVEVRLFVDAGLLLIVLASMAMRRPFTMQYAREQVAPAYWGNKTFIRTNTVITGAWALAFAVLVLADLLLLRVPQVPPMVAIAMTVGALAGAIKFSGWYPEQQRAKARALPG